jgi:hypothetical protein
MTELSNEELNRRNKRRLMVDMSKMRRHHRRWVQEMPELRLRLYDATSDGHADQVRTIRHGQHAGPRKMPDVRIQVVTGHGQMSEAS